MATNFPGSVDTFTNPTSGDTLDSPSHSAQHANINDAMVAVQTRLGAQSGTIGTWTTYTPVLTATTTNPTLGTGSTAQGWYTEINKLVIYYFEIEFGTSGTNAGSGVYRISLPKNAEPSTRTTGVARLYDSSTAQMLTAVMDFVNSQTIAEIYFSATTNFFVANNAPWAWAASDQINGTIIYRAA